MGRGSRTLTYPSCRSDPSNLPMNPMAQPIHGSMAFVEDTMDNTRQTSFGLFLLGGVMVYIGVIMPMNDATAGQRFLTLHLGGSFAGGFALVSGLAGMLFGRDAVRLREMPETGFQWMVTFVSAIVGAGLACMVQMHVSSLGYVPGYR